MIIAAIAVATALSASSQAQAATAAKQQGKAQQAIYEYNARLKEAEARNVERQAQIDEARRAEQQKAVLGHQKATFAKSGFSIEEGTSVDIMADTYGEFAVDRALILRKGLIDEMKLKSGAEIDRYQGQVAKQYGKNMARAGYLGMAGTIAGGVASAYYVGNSATNSGMSFDQMAKKADKWLSTPLP